MTLSNSTHANLIYGVFSSYFITLGCVCTSSLIKVGHQHNETDIQYFFPLSLQCVYMYIYV